MFEERLTYEQQLETDDWHKKRSSILERDSHKCQMCGAKGDDESPLNIHHRYYHYPRYAWAYDDSALITLCKRCHELVHLTLSPLVYAERDGKFVVMNFTPCYRCHGAGHFPEYRRIQNGICFRCRGQRYEELITNKRINIDEYITNRSVFDLKEKTLSNNEIKHIYEEAYSFHPDRYSLENITSESVSLYNLAAINGYAQAQNNLGYIIKMGYGTVVQDYETALRWFLYSAMQGIYQAQRNISQMFEFGIGVKKDLFLSRMWEMRTWQRNDNDASRYAIRRMRDNTLSQKEKEVYLKRLILLYSKGNQQAEEYLRRLRSLVNEQTGIQFLESVLAKYKPKQ